MKHTRIPFVMCMVLLCVACNSNESKIIEFAGQFAKAANIKDTTTVYRNYPSIKNYRFLLLPDNLSADKITITFNNDENNYVASLNADKKLVITLDSIGTCRIVDSYNVLKFDPKYNEVATLAAIPISDLSDMKKSSYAYMLATYGDIPEEVNKESNEDSYVCIKDNAEVRIGPGKEYPVNYLSLELLYECAGEEYNGEVEKQLLDKGYGTIITHIESLGIKKNGYLYVLCYEEGEGFGGDGWVSEQHLRPICRICHGEYEKIYNCRNCKGKGYVDKMIK